MNANIALLDEQGARRASEGARMASLSAIGVGVIFLVLSSNNVFW